jgi:small-conductance mechanosensitive channel
MVRLSVADRYLKKSFAQFCSGMTLRCRWLATFLMGSFFACILASTDALAQDSDGGKMLEPATLTYLNRPIMVFRDSVGPLTPQQRADFALRRLSDIDDILLANEIEIQAVVLADKEGLVLTLDGRLLFGVSPGDTDPEQPRTIQDIAEDAKAKLKEAFDARLEQQRPMVLLRAIGYSAGGAVLILGLIWLAWQLRIRIHDWASALITRSIERATHAGLDWRRYGYAFTARIVQLLTTFAILALIYLWVTFVLSQFPVTQPLGTRLGDVVLVLLTNLASSVINAVPGILTVAVIILLAQAISLSVGNVIRAAEQEHVKVPLIDPETAGATRKILRFLIWGIALAVAYPYIPGSDSLAFQGLSVLFGLMVSLGSTGVVSQMMSGTVLAYSRSLRPGDYVQIDIHEGTVSEVGAISTKLVTPSNAEVTIPNSVLVENTVINYSQRLKTGACQTSTKITIGYDTPWRQVHAMLLMAADRVNQLAKNPSPFVYQRALTDFYVEYELFVVLPLPADRVPALSALHGAIQDVFNEFGVQIMSPQFYEQPPQPLIVPKEKWFTPPAKR